MLVSPWTLGLRLYGRVEEFIHFISRHGKLQRINQHVGPLPPLSEAPTDLTSPQTQQDLSPWLAGSNDRVLAALGLIRQTINQEQYIRIRGMCEYG